MWIVWLIACSPSDAPAPLDEPVPWAPPDEVGPHAVGVRTVEIDDTRGGTLTLEVWTPSVPQGAPAAYAELLYELDTLALQDAPVLPGEHPMVLFSHGHGGSRLQSIFLTEQLASHGFVVVAVDHPLDTLFDFDDDQTPTVAARRPGDVQQALDWALDAASDPDHWLAGAIRPEGIGMLGHSFGAWTTLVLAGGGLDLEAADAACGAPDPPAGCGIVGAIDTDLPLPEGDPRITVSSVLAPGGWYSFGSLDTVHDILVVSGTADGDLPFDEEQDPTWQALGSPKRRLLLDDGGHFGFTDGCALVPIADCAGAADGYMEPLRMQALTKVGVTAFFGERLLGDDRYAPWVAVEGWDEPDASWEDD